MFVTIQFYFAHKVLADAKRDEKERLIRECYLEKWYCHPRWISDKMGLEREYEAAGTISYSIFDDAWNIVEIVCLTMANLQFLITVIYISLCDNACVFNQKTTHVKRWNETRPIQNAKMYFSSLFIVVTWVRMKICFRHTQFLGPLIQIAFFFFEFFTPFSVAGWVLFGGELLHKEGISGIYLILINLSMLNIRFDYRGVEVFSLLLQKTTRFQKKKLNSIFICCQTKWQL